VHAITRDHECFGTVVQQDGRAFGCAHRHQPLKGKLLAQRGRVRAFGEIFSEFPMKKALALVAVALVAYATIAAFGAGTADHGTQLIKAHQAAIEQQ
jgi:hypothetical protein